MAEQYSQERDRNSDQCSRVLQKYREDGGILACADYLPNTPTSLPSRLQLPASDQPGIAFKKSGKPEYEIIPFWKGRSGRMQQVGDPTLQRKASAQAKNDNRDNERPEINFFSMPKGMKIVGRPPTSPNPDDQ